MRIVAVSDTHLQHRALQVPDGDVLIHAGDFTRRGALEDVQDLNAWLQGLPHRHKIVIAGNHDWCFVHTPDEARATLSAAIYLQDEGTEIEGVRFYGSPWQPWFLNWAFNLQRGEEIRAKWSLIPDQVDVLITHGPPLGHGDLTAGGDEVGCADLLDRIQVVRPKVHIFGHIHEGAGQTSDDHTTYVNASVLDEKYRLRHAPHVIDL